MNKWLFLFLGISLIACKNNSSTNIESEPVEAVDTVEIEPAYVPKFDYDTTKWMDVRDIDPSIVLDIRYATENNFVEEKMYECGRCFLRPRVAKAIVAAHQELQKEGLGLKMFDCYRPRPIQYKLWEKVPDRRYVADPKKGSMHNRGGAVDLTIIDSLGNQLEMGTTYDFFGKEAYHRYRNHSDTIQANRDRLLSLMDKYDMKPTPTEWWHYSYRKKFYDLSDMLWNCE